ncbi:MAG: hypothetical protein WCD35_16295 [Mycobacteriales bacterium]
MAPNSPTTQDVPPGGVERRRYNRRAAPSEPSPPYFEVFMRIAVALEGIQDALAPQAERREGGDTDRRMPSPRSE